MFNKIKGVFNQDVRIITDYDLGLISLGDFNRLVECVTVYNPMVVLKRDHRYMIVKYSGCGELTMTTYNQDIDYLTKHVIYTQPNRFDTKPHNFNSTNLMDDRKNDLNLSLHLGENLSGYNKVISVDEIVKVIKSTQHRYDHITYACFLDEVSLRIFNGVISAKDQIVFTHNHKIHLMSYGDNHCKLSIEDLNTKEIKNKELIWCNLMVKPEHVLMSFICDIVLPVYDQPLNKIFVDGKSINTNNNNNNNNKSKPSVNGTHGRYIQIYKCYESDVEILLKHYDRIMAELSESGHGHMLPPIKNKSDLCDFITKFVSNEYFKYLYLNSDSWIINHIINEFYKVNAIE